MTEGEVRCTRCGALTRKGDGFCRGCGAALSAPRPGDPASPTAVQAHPPSANPRAGGAAPTLVGITVVLLLLAGIVALVGGERILGGGQDAAGINRGGGDHAVAPSATPGPEDGTLPGGVDPAFDEMVDGWLSSGTDIPLLLPTYVPFAVDGVGFDPFDTGTNNYYVWSDTENQAADHLRVEILSATEMPAEYMARDAVTIDGEEYPYTEDTSWVTGTEAPEGQYTVALWVDSEDGEEYIYYVELNHYSAPLPYEEFVETVTAMEKLDPSDA